MTREEAARWLYVAGWVLGEAERFWYGSLYDLGRDLERSMLKDGPSGVKKLATSFRPMSSNGPKMRALCLFARRVAREVA